MKEKVAVATVQGKAYFLIVNALREQNISFISILPGQPVYSKVNLVITTPEEKFKVDGEKIIVFQGEENLETLVIGIKKQLMGKEAYEKIIIGIDPGGAIGVAVMADGKVIEENNCYNSQELMNSILKTLRTVNFAVTSVLIKIGNGVPVYKELLKDLDESLPVQAMMEVVGEAGTNRPLKQNGRSRKIRHISSAIRIAGRTGHTFARRKSVAADSTTQ